MSIDLEQILAEKIKDAAIERWKRFGSAVDMHKEFQVFYCNFHGNALTSRAVRFHRCKVRNYIRTNLRTPCNLLWYYDVKVGENEVVEILAENHYASLIMERIQDKIKI